MPTIERELTYAGRRLNQRGSLSYFYSAPDDPDNLRGYPKPLVSGTKVGAIVRLIEEEDGTYYVRGPNAPRVVGHAPPSPTLLQWSANQEADVAVHAQNAESKRIAATGEDPMRKALEPVRDQLRNMSSARRAAAIGWIITYLSTGQGR